MSGAYLVTSFGFVRTAYDCFLILVFFSLFGFGLLCCGASVANSVMNFRFVSKF